MGADAFPTFEAFKKLPQAVTLLGMSGVGKTTLSTSLRRSANWFHFSADYRIGTAYLAEHILDNIKFKIMRMEDPFVARLLRSDSIYINHNISVDNLDPVSTFLGMYGDPAMGGLDKATFVERQDLYRQAEVHSMTDVPRFMEKGWKIYSCHNFVNDASGSLCEIADIDNTDDPVIRALRETTLILYIRASTENEETLRRRAETDPKPLFYYPDFIRPRLADQPASGTGVDPMAFSRSLFGPLLADRKPRYEKFATNHGFAVEVDRLFGEGNGTASDSARFLDLLYEVLKASSEGSALESDKVDRYLQSCHKRVLARGGGA